MFTEYAHVYAQASSSRYTVTSGRCKTLSGKKKKNMKRQNGATVACNTFFLHVLQVDFGYIAVLNLLIKAYLWPSIVLICCSSASFAEAR